MSVIINARNRRCSSVLRFHNLHNNNNKPFLLIPSKSQKRKYLEMVCLFCIYFFTLGEKKPSLRELREKSGLIFPKGDWVNIACERRRISGCRLSPPISNPAPAFKNCNTMGSSTAILGAHPRGENSLILFPYRAI